MQSDFDEREDLETPKITVCVAAYNVKPYLCECLDSLADQSLKDAEFIIVDDGSTDGSSAICDVYAQKDPRFHVIHHKKNQGLMLARKTGIKQAKGEYLIFLDGDDRLASRSALSSLAERLEVEKVDVLRFCVECFGENAKIVKSMQLGLRHHPYVALSGTLSVLQMLFKQQIFPWCVWCQSYRTEIAKKAAQFCPNEKQTMAEDVFWSFALISLAKSFKWIQTDPIYSYRVGTGISTSIVTLGKFEHLSMQHRVADWLKAFVESMQLGDVYLDLVESARETLIMCAARALLALPRDERGRGFELFIRWGHHAQIYEAIQRAQIEVADTRKLYTFKAFRLWALGRVAFSRDARHYYRRQLLIFLR